MSKKQKILLILTLLGVFIIVYAPHFYYPYPFHVDEWHHISEAVRLDQPSQYFSYLSLEVSRRFSGLEIGFHGILLAVSKIFDLLLIYKFLPALWAVFGSLSIFYVAYKKSNDNFIIAWFSLIFFASIRSNTNLTGLWFFTPLTFSIPFIFLYFYLFESGVNTGRIKPVIYALLILLCLIPIHPLSVLFSLPIFIIYSLINYRFWLANKLLLFLFSLLGIFGFTFYLLIIKLPLADTVHQIISSIYFRWGWGVLELNNSIFDVYSWLALFLSAIGVYYFISSGKIRDNLIFIIWPAYLAVSIIIFRIFGFSFFSPFQRNLYYLSIALPFLSAYGIYFIVSWLGKKGVLQTTVYIFLLPILLPVLFYGYYKLPNNLPLYRVLTNEDYIVLKKLSQYAPAVVMADHFLSTALYPISGHEPVGSMAFYGNRADVEKFYYESVNNCDERKKILTVYNVDYYINRTKDKCNLGELLFYEPGDYVYKVFK